MRKLFASLITIAAAVALCIILPGCREEKKYRIGVSQCSQDDWRSKMNEEIEREIMFHKDAEVEIRSADDDSRKQIRDLQYFVDNKFDAIIVSPNEAATLTPVIEKIYKEGIPVIIFDRNISSDAYTARIGADDIGIGREAAHYARHLAGSEPKAIEIFGLPGSTPAEDRHKGFAEEFTRENGTILASVAANWNKQDAIRVADSLLRIYPDADVIYAHNDRMAIGASEVARKLGRNVKIIGIDAAPSIGIQAVADSVIDATFLYPTEGYKLIQTALDILKGNPYEKEVMLPSASAVDKTNADILLLQNDNLVEETGRMKELKNEVDSYWEKHSYQTSLFYSSIAIILLLCGVFFLMLRSFWQNKKHQSVLEEQNRLLEEERDKQKELNVKLEEATQSKLVFFTNVSHDLRTPLTLISEPVAQLASADNLTDQQRTLIKIADKNVRILQRLINQILDFRKFENGKLDLNLSEVNFSQAVAEWTDSFRAIARKRHIKLSIQGREGHPDISLAIDQEKIERVFFNLLSNAFKYTPDNGTITVDYSADGKMLTFSVADTGEGISERDLGNIFDRFFQVDRVHPKGSGIGLSLAKAFVELHRGTINVESTPGKGSRFTVTIPISHVAESASPIVAIDGKDVAAELDTIDEEVKFDDAKPLLLVIDDNKDIQQLTSELMRSDYNVITASNGAEGVRKAAKYVPDIVVCDVMMPVMDGMECCRRIKEEVTTSHIPVVMLTACSLDEQRAQGYDSGADGYISKPFDANVLKSRCRSLINNRKRIKELWGGSDPVAAAERKSEVTAMKSKPLPKSDIDSDFYNRFLDIFTKEMGNPDTNVDKIAAQMGLERSQFYRKIKALTNYSPVELMRNLRLKKGRELLLKTDKSVGEIAYETGFSTPAYFTKCYRDAYGITPTEARAEIGK